MSSNLLLGLCLKKSTLVKFIEHLVTELEF